jgi:hypothetical protein
MFLATHGLPNDLPRRLPEQVVGEVGWGALHASWAHAMQHAGRLVEATSALLVAQSSDVLGHLVMALIPYRQLHLDSLYFERHLVVAALARPSDPPPRRVLPRNLLSAADLVPALGPIDSGMAHTYPGTDGLTYHSLTYTCEGGEDSPGSFVVSVVGGTASPASYAAYFARRNAEQPGAYRQVEGVGDNAFISSASDSLSVRCDDMSLVFSTVGGARLTEAELVGIARLALKRARAVGP